VLRDLPVPAGDDYVHLPEGTPRTLDAVARVAVIPLVALLLAAPASAQPSLPGTADRGVYPRLRGVSQLADPEWRSTDAAVGVYPALDDPGRLAWPTAASVDAARRYARARHGMVSFAVADLRGGIAGLRVNRPYRSASLSKAMVFVAYLRKLEREHRKPARHEEFSLDAMIRVSDNDSATYLYKRLGPGAMQALARQAGMRSFAAPGPRLGSRRPIRPASSCS
jgi:hypothetical protein